jgi:methylenetetrahydrofolate reductase (NADPH)
MIKSFCDKLGKEFVVTGEYEPGSDVSRKFLEKAGKFKGHVDALNSIDSPLGIPQISAAVASYLVKEELGIEPIMQMCARDRNRTCIINDLLGAKLMGMNHMLCIAGDYSDKCKPVYELDSARFTRLVAEEMSKKYKGFEMKVGVGYNPMVTPQEPQNIALEKKMQWADFIQTQPIYDFSLLENETAEKFKEKMMVGVLPLLNKKMGEYFNKSVPGFDIDPSLLAGIRTPDDGIDQVRGLIKEIKKAGFGGIHLMVFEIEDRIGEILKGAKD